MITPRNKRLVVDPIDDVKPSTVIEIVQFDKFNTKSSGLESKSWTRGVVLAVGNECDHVNGAKVGDTVQFTKNGGLPVKHDGRDLLILSEKDIIGVEYDEEEFDNSAVKAQVDDIEARNEAMFGKRPDVKRFRNFG